jgi:hypothetical protein
MAAPMFCTDCRQTAEADTLLEGSDVLEMLAWCCLALPGLLYCWWRHALRIKACPYCGGRELVRQARAAQLREPGTAAPAQVRVRSLTGPVRWPRLLATPRERLRHGSAIAALATAALLCLLVASLSGGAATLPMGAGAALLGVCCAQVARLLALVSAERALGARCRAWDARGRALQIELMS